MPNTAKWVGASHIAHLGALVAPVRRQLFEYVAARSDPVGRDEAARAVRTGRPLATYHLEKLVEAGLLEVAQAQGSSGLRGRPPKRYVRSNHAGEITLPPRDYALFGRILSRGARSGAAAWLRRLRRAADALGREHGREVRAERSAAQRMRALMRTLGGMAYEPRLERGVIRLANCPFGALSAEAPDAVCATNLAFLKGLTDALGRPVLGAAADPAPRSGSCCAVIRISGI